MSEVEIAVNVKDIIKMLGWSLRKFHTPKWKKELISAGVIFYRMEGRPRKKKIYAFPSRLIKWVAHKAAKGEMI